MVKSRPTMILCADCCWYRVCAKKKSTRNCTATYLNGGKNWGSVQVEFLEIFFTVKSLVTQPNLDTMTDNLTLTTWLLFFLVLTWTQQFNATALHFSTWWPTTLLPTVGTYQGSTVLTDLLLCWVSFSASLFLPSPPFFKKKEVVAKWRRLFPPPPPPRKTLRFCAAGQTWGERERVKRERDCDWAILPSLPPSLPASPSFLPSLSPFLPSLPGVSNTYARRRRGSWPRRRRRRMGGGGKVGVAVQSDCKQKGEEGEKQSVCLP